MKIIIAGGTGQIGGLLVRHWQRAGHDVVVLSRRGLSPARVVPWDGQTIGPWAEELAGCDVLVNLAGRSVNCRYTEKNLRLMLDSRVQATRVLGAAIRSAAVPPRVWLNMSTATVYAHSLDKDQDEATGVIGGNEPGVPAYWRRSVEIATAWEAALDEAVTPKTRKLALRTAMVMSLPTPTAESENIFSVLKGLTRWGCGGAIAGGAQYVSWIHAEDFANACDYLIDNNDLSGAVNLCAPEPLPQRLFMKELRTGLGVRVGLPATSWMISLGAMFMGSDPELLLKSRRVFPGKLVNHGFVFRYPTWTNALTNLLGSNRNQEA